MGLFRKNQRKINVINDYNLVSKLVYSTPEHSIALDNRHIWGKCTDIYAYESIFDEKLHLRLYYVDGKEKDLNFNNKNHWEIIETLAYVLKSQAITYRIIIRTTDDEEGNPRYNQLRFSDLTSLNDYLSVFFKFNNKDYRYIRTTDDEELKYGYACYKIMHIINGKWVKYGLVYIFPEYTTSTLSHKVNNIFSDYDRDFMYEMLKTMLNRQTTNKIGLFTGPYKGYNLSLNYKTKEIELHWWENDDKTEPIVVNEKSSFLKDLIKGLYNKPLYTTTSKPPIINKPEYFNSNYKDILFQLMRGTNSIKWTFAGYIYDGDYLILPINYEVETLDIMQGYEIYQTVIIENAEYNNETIQKYREFYGDTENN